MAPQHDLWLPVAFLKCTINQKGVTSSLDGCTCHGFMTTSMVWPQPCGVPSSGRRLVEIVCPQWCSWWNLTQVTMADGVRRCLWNANTAAACRVAILLQCCPIWYCNVLMAASQLEYSSSTLHMLGLNLQQSLLQESMLVMEQLLWHDHLAVPCHSRKDICPTVCNLGILVTDSMWEENIFHL